MTDQSDNILRSLGRIEGKIDGMDGRLKQHRDDIDSVEKDVTELKLQAAKNGVIGGGIAGLVSAAGGTKLIEFLRSMGS